jgi:hypothetical protein
MVDSVAGKEDENMVPLLYWKSKLENKTRKIPVYTKETHNIVEYKTKCSLFGIDYTCFMIFRPVEITVE